VIETGGEGERDPKREGEIKSERRRVKDKKYTKKK